LSKLFKQKNDEFHVKAVQTLDQACKLIEVGFESVTDLDYYKVFRKRKNMLAYLKNQSLPIKRSPPTMFTTPAKIHTIRPKNDGSGDIAIQFVCPVIVT
jgi:hypothetical protein